MEIFKKEFLEISPDLITHEVKTKGYFSFPCALNDGFLHGLKKEIGSFSPSINQNTAVPVWKDTQYYFTHALASSQSYFNLLTSPFIRSIAKSKFNDYFRLKCHRYYETYYGHSMEWHADNVTNKGAVTDVDGLIFIIYINDVFDGEFQIIEGTNKDRKKEKGTYNYTNKFISDNYSDKIKTFSMPAGSVILYDTFHIHRAKPIINKSFVRQSIFFQVDASDKHTEKLLINPEFFNSIDSMDISNLEYLGFGKKAEFKSVPVTDEKDLPIKHIANFGLKLIKALAVKTVRSLINKFLTHDQKMRYYEYRKSSKKT
jgi:hypothetical protein